MSTDPFVVALGMDDQDIEVEEDQDTNAEPPRPYDPTLIRVDPKVYSLRNVLDMIDEGDLDVAPDFQRLKVWRPLQKSRLIESIFLRIPLPAFYFSSDTSGRLQVVDGVQRLTTIYDFTRGGANKDEHFRLNELEYLQDQVGGRTFDDLEPTMWAKRLYSTQIHCNVIDPQTPTQVKFDIFRRINTGGEPLTAQEIRHCMSGSASRKLLKELSQSDEFDSATGGKVSGNLRMADREMVLRVLAFRLDPLQQQEFTAPSLDEFLNNATEKIDLELTQPQRDELGLGFLQSMRAARRLFGIHAFRKWPTSAGRNSPMNRALFEVWGTLLFDYSDKILEAPETEKFENLIADYRDHFDSDNEFVTSISSATGSPRRIKYRFSTLRDLLARTFA